MAYCRQVREHLKYLKHYLKQPIDWRHHQRTVLARHWRRNKPEMNYEIVQFYQIDR